jgi:GDP-4-dehydro-6-deoxy-D-mannose reductase
VTGGQGFVGGWLVDHLRTSGDDVVITTADITDAAAIDAEINAAQPDAIYHLAALAAVGASWSATRDTVNVNVMGTFNVLDSARRLTPMPRVLMVSSADVYGRAGHDTAISETTPTRPDSPYAGSKAAAEQLARQHLYGFGLPVTIVRPFNHIGPGQSDSFLISALAHRIALAERDGADTIAVGNLDAERDYTDVRDVVRAYRTIVERGQVGAIYNVCSGRARSGLSMVTMMLAAANRPLQVETDPSLLRPVDAALLVGDCSALRRDTGWKPDHDVAATVVDVLEWWRTKV